jgi:putative transposase
MSAIPADLQAFINEHRDSREYRRGLAVKLALHGYLYATICEMLDVTPGFISQAKTAYETDGIDGLRLKYQGGQPFLTDEQRQAVIRWLKAEQSWSVEQLRSHSETTYAVVYKSNQSYYELLAEAGITYKRAQARNPKHDPEQVTAKKKLSRHS